MTGTRWEVPAFRAELICLRQVSGDHKPRNLAKSVTVE
jgi:hypothetical protein